MSNPSKKFTLQDQYKFAEISGDYNDIHLNEKVARRSIFGYPIVHGINLVLWAIESELSKNKFQKILYLEALFKNSVYLNETVFLKRKLLNKSVEINLYSRDRIVTSIKLDIEKSYEDNSNNQINPNLPPYEKPLEITMEEMEGNQGKLELFLNYLKFKSLFPLIADKLPKNQIATIISTSRLVGNICPGTNSLFTKILLHSKKNEYINKLFFSVSKIDKRFNLINLNIKSPSFNGEIQAFERPPKIKQKKYSDFRKVIPPESFSNIKALVIGGSRGLGEVTTKILCAGGAEVVFTFFNGKAEAEEIVADIQASGAKIESLFLDIKEDLPIPLPKVNLLVYMPTPFIFDAVKSKFSPLLFKKFLDYYIFGLHKIITNLDLSDPLVVFNPSSVAIDDLPLNMGEYSSAKAASEIMSNFLEKANINLKFHCPRLSRLNTDQTNSIRPTKNENPIPVIFNELNIIKEFY